MLIEMKYIFTFFVLASTFLSQNLTEPVYYLSSDTLNTQGGHQVGKYWKFKSGDNIDWANPNFDDSEWKLTTSTLNFFESSTPEFQKKGWFRLSLRVDSLLLNKPIAFDAWMSGSAEIYLNGKKLFEYGIIENNQLIERKLPLFPKIISFEKVENVIAVRYFNNLFSEMEQTKFTPGFAVEFGYPEVSINNRYEYTSRLIDLKITFVTIALVLALVHLFLFLFDRKQIQNLYYILFLLFFSAFLWINLNTSYGKDVAIVFYLYRLGPAALIFTILFGSTTIHSIYKPLGRFYKYIFATAVVLSILGFLISHIALWFIIYAFISLVSFWGSQSLYNPKFSRNTESDWYIRIGFAVMGIAGIYQMLLSMNILGPIFGIWMPFIYGVVVFILSMSIALARDYASTSKKLEKKLKEVKELSDKTLAQELAAKELEVEKRILESDNKRKTEELESARQVQLAMLPENLNNIDGLDICFDMHTATEVGGDYYDYKITNDGTLNLVIGDATGHGMKAGIMVATIKSLFSALGTKMMIPDFFQKCTEIIKSMSLGNLFMSMIFLRIKDDKIIGSIAGMPPILVYRKEENKIEEILQKSMPLGAPLDFQYDIFETELNIGDFLLLMSDGFIELFNTDKEMFGLERTKDHILKNADSTANELVNSLIAKGEEWRAAHPQEDDITFVLIKKK